MSLPSPSSSQQELDPTTGAAPGSTPTEAARNYLNSMIQDALVTALGYETPTAGTGAAMPSTAASPPVSSFWAKKLLEHTSFVLRATVTQQYPGHAISRFDRGALLLPHSLALNNTSPVL